MQNYRDDLFACIAPKVELCVDIAVKERILAALAKPISSTSAAVLVRMTTPRR